MVASSRSDSPLACWNSSARSVPVTSEARVDAALATGEPLCSVLSMRGRFSEDLSTFPIVSSLMPSNTSGSEAPPDRNPKTPRHDWSRPVLVSPATLGPVARSDRSCASGSRMDQFTRMVPDRVIRTSSSRTSLESARGTSANRTRCRRLPRARSLPFLLRDPPRFPQDRGKESS